MNSSYGFHIWTMRRINDGHMKLTSVYDFYVLGKKLHNLSRLTTETTELGGRWKAHDAYKQLAQSIADDSVLLPATKDAAKKLMAAIEFIFGNDISTPPNFPFLLKDTSSPIGQKIKIILASLDNFETVFRADLPRMSVFGVEQKGMYQTEMLIDKTDQHFPEPIKTRIPSQAKMDIVLAGKCLAFDVHTASAFHMWRALEVVFGTYYVSITGNTFEHDKVVRNWGKYIEALEKAGADKGIIGNLDHIRKTYRNPVIHPNVNISAGDAFALLGIGISAITQVMQEIDLQPHAKKALA